MIKKEQLKELSTDLQEAEKLVRGRQLNDKYSGYYETLAGVARLEGSKDVQFLLERKALNMKLCNAIIYFNKHEKSFIKEKTNTLYCHDKFCPICQELIARKREEKYMDHIIAAEKEYDLYHLTLTLKNCKGAIPPWAITTENMFLSELKENIKQMSKCFQKLTRYLIGHAKIAGLNLTRYGYAGAIRVLEITFTQDQEYHPHYHCIIALKKGLKLEKTVFNKYSIRSDSWTGEKTVTLFSNFEILIQKIWYLVLNNQKVTLSAIEALPEGYSCYMRKADKSGLHQAFKYAVKPDKDNAMTLENFQDLYYALRGYHILECYGIFRQLPKIDKAEEVDAVPSYTWFVNFLRHYDPPVRCAETPAEIREFILKEAFTYINRSKFAKLAAEVGDKKIISYIKRCFSENEPKKAVQLALLPFKPKSKRPDPDPLFYLTGGRSVKPKKN